MNFIPPLNYEVNDMQRLETAAIDSQSAVKPALSEHREKPYLTAESKLILHTYMAKSLFEGTWGYEHFGLVQFAKATRSLWEASRDGDPYAEWYLLKIYDAIEKAKLSLKQQEKNIENQLQELRGFKIDLLKNPVPFELPLRFATPFAFMGAVLLEYFDYLNRQLYTLKRIGILPKDELIPAQLMGELKSIFILASEWKYTRVTRKDIREDNQLAKKAKELLGEVPASILNKEIKFAFLPKARKENAKA